MPVATHHDVAVAAAPGAWRSRLALGAILLLAGLLRTLWLSQNGYGRTYYAAGVRSMLESWHNFFFNAFDPAGFVSLDKPPVALWLQVASAKVVGFNGIAMLLPQVLEGLIAIVLVYALVRRSFGELAGLLAALFLALTPISVAVDRSNNTDSCLVMVLLVAVWAFMRALETGRTGYLLASMACVGLGFNVKMGAALVLVPAMAATYLVAPQPRAWLRKIGSFGAGGGLLIIVALSWAAVYDLVPAASRPYVGSTTHNSMLELALLHNGLARFVGPARGPEAAGSEDPVSIAEPPARPRLWDDTPVGVLRLLRPYQAAQVGWLLPLALASLLLGAVRHRQGRLSASEGCALMLWGGWLLGYWIVFSYAGGVFHTYYLAALAPPVAALAGIAVAHLWVQSRSRLLPLSIVLAVAWMAWLSAGYVEWRPQHWSAWLCAGAISIGLVAGLCLSWSAWGKPPPWRGRLIEQAALASALAALLAMPAAWSLSVVLVRPNVAAPSANLAALMRPAAEASEQAARAKRAEQRRGKLVAFLRAHHGNERYILGVPNALQAAPIIVATGVAVMAMGGYLGRDPILTPADLQRLAEQGELRFVMIGGASLVQADAHQQAIAQWVRANGRLVDRSLWFPALRRSTPAATTTGVPARFIVERAELYDIRPSPGSAEPPR